MSYYSELFTARKTGEEDLDKDKMNEISRDQLSEIHYDTMGVELPDINCYTIKTAKHYLFKGLG
jgi:hypothetical protein